MLEYRHFYSLLTPADDLLWRTRYTLNIDQARPRDIQSLQNWIDSTGSIARPETLYLAEQRDLVSLGRQGDNIVQRLETWVEDKLIRFWRGFRKNKHHDVSDNPDVYLYSGPLIRRVARTLLLVLITILLVIPIIICNVVSIDSVRIVIVLLSIISYLLVLFALTESRAMELILAGATYATILTVFVSGTGNVGN